MRIIFIVIVLYSSCFKFQMVLGFYFLCNLFVSLSLVYFGTVVTLLIFVLIFCWICTFGWLHCCTCWLHCCTLWLHFSCLCCCTSLLLCLLVSGSGANTRIGTASRTGNYFVWQRFPYQTLLCLRWGTQRPPDSRA